MKGTNYFIPGKITKNKEWLKPSAVCGRSFKKWAWKHAAI